MDPEEIEELSGVVRDTSAQINDLDAQRDELARVRRRAMWKLLQKMSLAQVADLARMHRGAVHKDLARHINEKED